MKIKKYVLLVSFSLLVFVFIVSNPIIFGFCRNITEYGTGNRYCSETMYEIPEVIPSLSFFLGGLIFFFSLITYKMKDQVFRAWWNFARWFALIIIVSSVLLGMGVLGGGGGWGIASGLGEFVILSLLYIIFVLVSLVQIVWVYIKTMKTV